MSALPTSSQLLAILRKKLQKSGTSITWLTGLKISVEPGRIILTLDSPLFTKWYFNSHAEKVETILKHALPGNYILEYDSGQLLKGTFPGANALPEPSLPFFARLDDFMDNGKNASALEAARMLANARPSNCFGKPALVIFCGEPGSGKTHILQGIHAELLSAFPSTSPILARARQFLQTDSLARDFWQGRFWELHAALLLDDLDEIMDCAQSQMLLAGAIAQAELISAANAGFPMRLILGFGGEPARLAAFTASLYARLQKGMIFQLLAPDLTIRLNFIENLLSRNAINLRKEQLLFLARQSHHLPVLQGIVKKIHFFKTVANRLPTKMELEGILAGQNPAKLLDWRQIMEKVCKKFDVQPTSVLENNRKPEIAMARQISMYLCRSRLGISLAELGSLFGGKDHSTVLHSVKKIEKMRFTDKVTHNLLAELEKDLASP